MGEVIEFGRKQWASGNAFCIACDHKWVAVAETGVTQLECPNCHTMKGKWLFEFMPTEGQLVATCKACTNQLFYLTPDGHMCANCGLYINY